jgi:hypothetical protein
MLTISIIKVEVSDLDTCHRKVPHLTKLRRILIVNSRLRIFILPTTGGNHQAVDDCCGLCPRAIRTVCSTSMFTTYSMKKLQQGVFTGMQIASMGCFSPILTIDRNTKKVYMSFVRRKMADNYDGVIPGICGDGSNPPTQVLMNCTPWAKIRKPGALPAPRYCDFSNADDK